MSMSKRHNPDGIRARMREIAERNPEDFGPGTNPLEDDTPHRDNEIIRLRRQLATAREALRPFAHYAAEHERAVSTLFTDNDSLWRCPGVADLTLGDCRRARRALAVLDGEDKADG